jgi:hypothetical protein
MAKKALGRGIGALIPTEPRERSPRERNASAHEIDITLIESNKHQPRKSFNEEELQGLPIHRLRGHHRNRSSSPARENTIVAGRTRWRGPKLAALAKSRPSSAT